VLLAQASVRGDVSDLSRALSMGANVDSRADLCIAMGANQGKGSKRLTSLMRACHGGHTEAVSFLVAASASLWRADSEGWTPLCHALAAGELKIARQLLASAGPNADRQKKIACSKKVQILESCDDVGHEVLEVVRNEFESPDGFMAVSGDVKDTTTVEAVRRV